MRYLSAISSSAPKKSERSRFTEVLIRQRSTPRMSQRFPRESHAPRELLEEIIAAIPGLRPVERLQFDRIMIEVSGAVRDGIVDPEKTQTAALKLGADAIIMGTILDLKEVTTEYLGYVNLK